MRNYYCMRCKAFTVLDPQEYNCPACKKELADALAKRGMK